jgi:OOP family OmpA-OmpF porin
MKSLLIALVLLGTALTFYSALWYKSESIEDDITARVSDALDTQGAQDITVDVDGRHVTLTGVVYDEAMETAYLDTADETYGALGPIDGLSYQTDGGYITAIKDADGITLRGTVPNAAARDALLSAAQDATDGTVTDELSIAGPEAEWQEQTLFGLGQMADLTHGTLSTSSGTYVLAGETDADPEGLAMAVSERRAGWQSYVTSPADMQQLKDDVATRDTRIDALEARVAAETVQVESLTAERDAISLELATLRASLTEGQSDSAALRAEIATLQGELADVQNMIAAKDQAIADHRAEIATLKAALGTQQDMVVEKDQSITDLRAEIATLNTALDAQQNATGATGEQATALRSQLEAANQAMLNLTRQVADRDDTINALRATASDSESDQIAQLTANVADRDAQIIMLSGKVADHDGMIAELNTALAGRDATLAARDDKLAELMDAAQSSNQQTTGLQARVSDLTATLASRDAMIASLRNQSTGSVAADQCATQATAVLEGSQINFGTGNATISDDSVALLERLTGIALACVSEGLIVEIGGHTDDRGSDSDNQSLSEARAQAVVAFMQARGVPAAGLDAVGYGEANPIGDNGTAEGRAANRRISFDWQAR